MLKKFAVNMLGEIVNECDLIAYCEKKVLLTKISKRLAFVTQKLVEADDILDIRKYG